MDGLSQKDNDEIGSQEVHLGNIYKPAAGCQCIIDHLYVWLIWQQRKPRYLDTHKHVAF